MLLPQPPSPGFAWSGEFDFTGAPGDRVPASLRAIDMIFRRRRSSDGDPPVRVHGASSGGGATDPRDLVMGAVSGYSYQDVQYWVNSLKASGYGGRALVIAYTATYDLVDRLLDRGVEVVTFGEEPRRRRFMFPRNGFTHDDTSIDRFYQMWRVLQAQEEDVRYVLAIDVRDVIFQRDPCTWLDANLGEKQINVGSEGIRLADEAWNSEVVMKSYGPTVHDNVARREVYNAGTIAGRGAVMRDLALNVFLSSRHNHIPYTDQAALNILLSLEPYRSITRFNRPDADWACQAATIAADSEYLATQGKPAPAWTPVFDGDHVLAGNGARYCIVHQYDRVPEWKARLQSKYAD
jgi:hypothetical protein